MANKNKYTFKDSSEALDAMGAAMNEYQNNAYKSGYDDKIKTMSDSMSMADCIFNMAVAYALAPGAGSGVTEGMKPFEKIKAGVRDAGKTMNLIMSSSAASSTFSEKLSEGYTTSEAALLAGLSGFAEYITEEASATPKSEHRHLSV